MAYRTIQHGLDSLGTVIGIGTHETRLTVALAVSTDADVSDRVEVASCDGFVMAIVNDRMGMKGHRSEQSQANIRRACPLLQRVAVREILDVRPIVDQRNDHFTSRTTGINPLPSRSSRLYSPFQRYSTGVFRLANNIVIAYERTIVERFNAEDRPALEITGKVVPRGKRFPIVSRSFQRPDGRSW